MKMPSTQQPNCQRSNQVEVAETTNSSLPVDQEKWLVLKQLLAINSRFSLGVNQSGKEQIYNSWPPSSTPPTKKSLLLL